MTARHRAPTPSAGRTDAEVVEALRAGDEATFAELFAEHDGAFQRVARSYVSDPDAAADVVQETWLGVINGIDRFEGRSSLKTWMFRILVNRAKTRGVREARVLPFSSADDTDEPPVAPDRFFPDGHPSAGHWCSPPASWRSSPELSAESVETREVLERAIDLLPETQRLVLTLRDVHGLSARETCDALGITDGNQRVLLHRARSRVRTAIEAYVVGGAA